MYKVYNDDVNTSMKGDWIMTQTRKNILSILIILTMVFAFVGAMNVETTYAATKKPAKVTGLKVTKASDTKVKISWKKAKNAKKYQVYQKKDDGNYKLVKTTTKKSCTVAAVQEEAYSYKVRGINGSKKGSFSKSLFYRLFPARGIKIRVGGQLYPSNTVSLSFNEMGVTQGISVSTIGFQLDKTFYYSNPGTVDAWGLRGPYDYMDSEYKGYDFNISPVSKGNTTIFLKDTTGNIVAQFTVFVGTTEKVMIQNTLPFVSTDDYGNSFRIEQASCRISTDSAGVTMWIDYSGTYQSSNGGLYYAKCKICDSNGYVLSSKNLYVPSGNTGDHIKYSDWFYLPSASPNDSFTVIFYN